MTLENTEAHFLNEIIFSFGPIVADHPIKTHIHTDRNTLKCLGNIRFIFFSIYLLDTMLA